ncbi:GIDE domain-containing protein [Candidatus Nitrospira bockiana]
MPTLQTPQVDVCPSRHGVWIDRSELALFLDGRVEGTGAGHGGIAVKTDSVACPRCTVLLDERVVAGEGAFSCTSCRGWWFPEGALTRLQPRLQSRASLIPVNEALWYQRARARGEALESRQTARRRGRHHGRVEDLLYWAIVFGIGVLALSVALWESVHRAIAKGQWIRPPDREFVLLMLGVLGGIGLFIYGFAVKRRKNLIEATPTSAVRSLAVGFVEIAGAAEPAGPPLNAPFSAMPCVLYSYKVDERQGTGKHARWVTVAQGQSHQAFFVRDATGAVMVLPVGADLALETRVTYRSGGIMGLPPTAEAGLAQLGISTGGWLDRTVRVSEGFILPGEAVYVLGTAQENRAATAVSENQSRLFIGREGEHDFVISDRSERELLARLRWQVIGFLSGGPALAAACVWWALSRYVG